LLKPPRTKRKAERSDVVSRKTPTSRGGRGLPLLAPKSNTTEEQAEGKVELLPNAAASKQAQVQLEEAATKVYVRKFPEKTDTILQAETAPKTLGDGRTEALHKAAVEKGVDNLMESKGFKDAPDAPSFSLGLTNDEDSQGMDKGHLATEDELYNVICRHNRLEEGYENIP